MRGGPIRRTDDGVLGVSGKSIRVFGASITSGAGGGGVVAFHNGTGTGGDLYFQGTGTASKAVLIPGFPAEGILFPGGCYVNVDANTSAVCIFAEGGN